MNLNLRSIEKISAPNGTVIKLYKDDADTYFKCVDIVKAIGMSGFNYENSKIGTASKMNNVTVLTRSINNAASYVMRTAEVPIWLKNYINLTLLPDAAQNPIHERRLAEWRTESEKLLELFKTLPIYKNDNNVQQYKVTSTEATQEFPKVTIRKTWRVDFYASYIDETGSRENISFKIFVDAQGDYYYQPYNLAYIFSYDYKGLNDSSEFAEALFAKANIIFCADESNNVMRHFCRLETLIDVLDVLWKNVPSSYRAKCKHIELFSEWVKEKILPQYGIGTGKIGEQEKISNALNSETSAVAVTETENAKDATPKNEPALVTPRVLKSVGGKYPVFFGKYQTDDIKSYRGDYDERIALNIYRSGDGKYYFNIDNLAHIFGYEYKGLQDPSDFAQEVFNHTEVTVAGCFPKDHRLQYGNLDNLYTILFALKTNWARIGSPKAKFAESLREWVYTAIYKNCYKNYSANVPRYAGITSEKITVFKDAEEELAKLETASAEVKAENEVGKIEMAENVTLEECKPDIAPATEIYIVTEKDFEVIGNNAATIEKIFGVPKKDALIAAIKFKAEEIKRDLTPLLDLLKNV